MEPRKKLRATLEDILAAARARQRECGRCGKGRGKEELYEYESGREGSWYSGT